MAGRWYPKTLLPKKPEIVQEGEPKSIMCPACRKQQDRVPSGVLKMMGNFVIEHKDEIMNLIRNEADKVQAINPLERVMGVVSTGNDIEITTTNEKLAQRMGKALHKAYSGTIEYKFSEDAKIARVYWRREL